MAYMNANAAKYGMRLHYSTPTFYMKTLHAKDHEWPLKVDDFETYAIGPDQFLVGCDPSPGVTLSFYTVADCHWLPLLRDLHSNRAVIAAIFSQNDGVAPG